MIRAPSKLNKKCVSVPGGPTYYIQQRLTSHAQLGRSLSVPVTLSTWFFSLYPLVARHDDDADTTMLTSARPRALPQLFILKEDHLVNYTAQLF